MRVRVDSTSYAEYSAAINFGTFFWRCRWPGFVWGKPESSPVPPVSSMQRLGYKYIGMLEAANDLPFDEIYARLLNGGLGKDLVDNVKLSKAQKVAYIVDRVGCVASSDPDAPDISFFGDIAIPVFEPFVDLVNPPEIVG